MTDYEFWLAGQQERHDFPPDYEALEGACFTDQEAMWERLADR